MLLVLADLTYWIVLLLHLSFAVLEMALWKKRAAKIFGLTQDFAEKSAALASNQGLYNLFIVIALLIGYLTDNIELGAGFMLYGLCCAVVAGIWGSITVSRRIFYIQAVPAIAALSLRLAMAV